MAKRTHTALLTLTLAALSVGCAAPAHRAKIGFGNDRHLIFNAEFTGYTVADVSRSPWPTTTAESDPNAEVTYRETIRDEQGRFSFNGNDYTRSVRSIRRGHGRR